LSDGPKETHLITAPRAPGAVPVDGLEILVRQGAASLRLWTGAEPPVATMIAAARGEVSE
jgi:shikimate dehydrogenase